VLQGNDPHTVDFYRLCRIPAVMGDRDFRDRAREQAQSLDQEVDKQGLKHPVDLEPIVKAVADYYQIPESGLKRTARGKGKRNLPRWIAMKSCQEIGSAKLTEIANYFQVVTIQRYPRQLAG
jgi:chromosomal replication initiation ATPase DnaA